MLRPNLPAATRMMERLDALARHTDEPGKLTRLYLSPAHKAAMAEVEGWMREAGLTPVTDAVGTISARYEGREPGLPALLLGSHIDSVKDAGKYDGPLGVLAALAVVEEVQRMGERLPFAIEILAFGDEEGVRFPMTLSGSKAVAGKFDMAALAGRDKDGISLGEALSGFGYDISAIPAIARKREDVLAYLELHIEQGPVLEAENQPLGIVSAIASIARLNVTLTGVAGHAGTVPMAYRKDALVAAAAMILETEAIARAMPGLVATTGRIEAKPGAVNVIAGDVTFSLDIRAPEDETRRAGVERILEACRAIAEARGIGITIDAGYEEEAALCHPLIREALRVAITALGYRPITLPSGAGHDAMAFVDLCPMGMLFLRCKDGISHNPAESITEEDAEIALRTLLHVVQNLDPAAFRPRA